MSARPPRVSILLPVRNSASTLPACLRSLRGQTLTEHEVVAVDDGSTDGSAELLEQAAAEDARLVLARATLPGLVPALNTALLRARAPILARMDADDVAHPERLRLQAESLERDPGLAIVGTRVEVLGGEGNEGMRAYVEWSNGLLHDPEIRRDLLVESPLVHPSVALRASALRDLGGYRAYDGPEDYDLWLRAAARGLRFAKRPEVLLQWRDSLGRLTRTDPRYGRERFFVRKLEALLDAVVAPGEGVVIWGAGAVGKAWARALRQRGVALRAFVEVDARKLGQRIHGAPVVEVAAAGAFKDALHLAAVGQRGARERIRACARHHGIREERLVAVA